MCLSWSFEKRIDVNLRESIRIYLTSWFRADLNISPSSGTSNTKWPMIILIEFPSRSFKLEIFRRLEIFPDFRIFDHFKLILSSK